MDSNSELCNNAKELYVGRFPHNMTEVGLKNIFEKFGNLIKLSWHNSFAYLEFSTSTEAEAALRNMKAARNEHGMIVDFAKKREKPPEYPPLTLEKYSRFDMFKEPVRRTFVPEKPFRPRVLNSERGFSNGGRGRYSGSVSISHYDPVDVGDCEEQECYNCKQYTDQYCKFCNTSFCSQKCMKEAALLHVSFCNTLVAGANHPQAKTKVLSITDRRSGSSDDGSVAGDSKAYNRVRKAVPLEGTRFVKQPLPPNAVPLGFNTRFDTSKWEPKNTQKEIKNGGNRMPSSNFSSSGILAAGAEHRVPTRRNDRSEFANTFNARGADETPLVAKSLTNGKSMEVLMTPKEAEASCGSPSYPAEGLGATIPDYEKKPAKNNEDPSSPIVVMFVHPEKGGWWVISKSNKHLFDYISEALEKDNMEDRPRVLATLGLVCAAPYEGSWYRVRITGIRPVMVHYIDYGNSAPCPQEDLRILSTHLQEIPDLVFYIKFAAGTSTKYTTKDLVDATLCLKVTETEGKTKIVTVLEKESTAPQEIKTNGAPVKAEDSQERGCSKYKSDAGKISSPLPLPSELPTTKDKSDAVKNSSAGITSEILTSTDKSLQQRFPSGSKVLIEVVHSASRVSISNLAELEKNSLLFQEVIGVCSKGSAPSEFPCAGSIVGCLFNQDNSFYRGRINKIVGDKAHVLFIDFGNEQLTPLSHIRILPLTLHCPPAAITVRLKGVPDCNSDSGKKFLEENCGKTLTLFYDRDFSNGIELKEANKSLNNYLIELLKPTLSELTPPKKIIKPENLPTSGLLPTPPSLDIIHSSRPLPSGTEVVVEFVGSVCEVFVSCVDKYETYALLMNDVAVACHQGTSPPELPPVGTVVGALFDTDKTFYRGIVTKHDGDNMAHIFFVDFGNEQATPLKDLRILPVKFQSTPPAAFRVKLKDVPESAPAGFATLLHELVALRKHVTLTYENSLKDGVELSDGGKNLNKQLIAAINQEPDLEVHYPIVGGPDELKLVDLNDGPQQLSITYLEDDVCDTGILFCMVKSEAMVGFVSMLSIDLDKYCTKLDVKAYRPHPGEICAGFFEDDWYRAVCIQEVDVVSVQVFFIDFGNTSTLDTSFIRPLNKSFKEYPPIAFKCILKGIQRANTIEKKKNIRKVLDDAVHVTADVCKRGDMFEVTIPEIETILSGD